MSSYEDVYGMAMSVFEALQNIQWKGPRQWELESIIDPISEQLLLKLSKSQNLVANPTLAAPTNIRYFLNNIQTSIDDPTQLFMFIAFLIAVPLFSTFFVAMLTNVNIVLKVLRLPLARNPVKASPLAVIFLMVTVFGNIPLVDFFPERAAHVQALLPVQPGHYHGVIARVLRIVASYEQFELAARVLLEMVSLVRYRRLQVTRLLRPASITAWLFTFAGFALRMWFTRVSTDTATSPIQSGSTMWVWGKVILRTDISYQSPDEFNDDVFIWIAYFVTTFCLSSFFVQYALAPRHEVYQPVEPTIIKVTASSSILTASAGCQTIVSGDDWVTKSSIAVDARKIDRIQAVIDSDMNRTAFFARNWCNEAEDASEDLKELTLLWQNDHTALQTHVSLLRGLRMVVEHHKEDAQKQRLYADKVSAAVRRLEQMINQREKKYDEKLKLCEKEYQDRIDAALVKVTALEKGTDLPDATLDDTNEKQASQPDASLGPRETESHSVIANTPELQKTPETLATVQCAPKSDTKSSSDPLLPSPPLSPPNADDSSSSSGSSNGDKNQESNGARPTTDTIEVPVASTSSTDLACSDNSPVRLAAAISSTTEGGVEPEKASDSEMDAANASGSDEEIMEEIGTGIWSLVQKFQFRSEPFTVHQSIVRQHFTVQEIQQITAMLIDFRTNVANDVQREQVSIILNAGFPYRMGIKFASDLDYLSVFLDLAELHKKPTKERIFTHIPTTAFSCACGVHPQKIGILNGRGKTWRTYPLKAYVEGGLDTAVGAEKAYIQRNSARLLNNLDRLLGGRPEQWNNAVPVEVLKTNQVWDMNLIARRLLENLGLIEFRQVTTEGTSTEEYIPPALVEPAPIKLTTNETPSTEASSAAEPTTVPVNGSLSIEIPPIEPPTTVPTSDDALSIEVPTADVSITVPTCGETPSPGVSQEVSTTTTTSSETPAIELPLAEITTAISTLNETTPTKAPSVSPPVTTPLVKAPFSELPSTLPSSNDPSPAQPLAIVSPDGPAQLQIPSTEELLLSPPEATPATSHPPVAPCIESPTEVSPSVVSQAQPSLTSSSSSVTPTRTTPFKFTAPDWRQEALQDLALQQQTQRPVVSGSQRNGRKSRGGKGRPRHSNT